MNCLTLLFPLKKEKKNKNKRKKRRSRASIALSRIATRNLTEFTRSKTSDVKINQVNSTWYQFNMMLAGGNANVWFCSVRNRTGIVRGTRVIVRNGRNDAFEPGGLIKSASKPHGSIFSDRLDDINCHFLLDTCHPANFNCPRIRGSHANAHDRQTWIQSRFQILIDRGGKFNSRCSKCYIARKENSEKLPSVLPLESGGTITVFLECRFSFVIFFFRPSVSIFLWSTRRLSTKRVNRNRRIRVIRFISQRRNKLAFESNLPFNTVFHGSGFHRFITFRFRASSSFII